VLVFSFSSQEYDEDEQTKIYKDCSPCTSMDYCGKQGDKFGWFYRMMSMAEWLLLSFLMPAFSLPCLPRYTLRNGHII